MLRRAGRNCEKSESCRALTHTGIAREAARDISPRSSAGTRRAFSQSRRTSRIRLASYESYGCDSSKPDSLSSNRPISSDVSASCEIRLRVASCSARTPAPPGGILTCWSQPRSDDVRSRSSISLTRSFSSAKAVSTTRPYLDRSPGTETIVIEPGSEATLQGSWRETGIRSRRSAILIAPQEGTGGPEGELRGRPPPPHAVLWCRRRTGSESVDGRARTRQRQE